MTKHTLLILLFLIPAILRLHALPCLEITSSPDHRTGPFTVLDQAKGVFGQYRRAPEIFHQSAAQAALRFDHDTLEVQFRCPVPPGLSLKPDPASSAGKGEYVEFFFSPSPKALPYFHYTVNVNGKKQARKLSAPGIPDPKWRSSFRAEVKTTREGYEVLMRIPCGELGITGTGNASLFRGNFTRGGDTAGGLSTWAPVGRNFHSPQLFGKLIAGGFQPYLEQRLSSLLRRLSVFQGNAPGECDQIRRRAERLKNALPECKDSPETFADLEDALTQLDFSLLHLEHGTNLLVWETSPWNNDFSLRPGTGGVEKISITVPCNGKVCFGLALTNFSTRPYLGRIKWFSKYNPHSFDGSGAPGADRIKLFEILELSDFNSMPLFDPLLELPLGSLVRTPPQTTTPLLIRVDGRSWKPGIYAGELAVKSERADFPTRIIPLEIRVSPVDVSGCSPDLVYYSYAFHRWNNDKNHELLKLYAGYGADTLVIQFTSATCFSRVWPKLDAAGRIQKESIDMRQIDSVIDRAFAAGFPRNSIKIMLDFARLKNMRFRTDGAAKPERGSETFAEALADTLHFWCGHWKKKYGIPQERILIQTIDEADGDVDNPESPIAQSLLLARQLKKLDPAFRLFANSLMLYKTPAATVMKNMRAQAEYFDVFCPLRWQVPEETMKIWRSRELWSYLVLSNTAHPLIYRRMFWQNFRDGMRGVCLFWHMEEHAGGDGFDFQNGWANGIRTNYGAVYADITYGKVLPSRRLEAHSLGREDYRLMDFCRRKLAERKDPGMNQRLQQIVSRGAAAKTMNELDGERQKLDALAEALMKHETVLHIPQAAVSGKEPH